METTYLSYNPHISIIDEDYKIPSLGGSRRIAALLPYDYYERDTRYPVLYLHDGQNLIDGRSSYGNWQLDKTLANLAMENFKDVIIVAIDHGGKKRIKEYFPYENERFGRGLGDKYLKFVLKDLKPLIDRLYRTKPERESTGIGGSSMGGLISLYAGIRAADVFSKYMIFSPSLWIAPQIYHDYRTLASHEEIDMYIYCGGRESKEHFPNVQRFANVLKDELPPHSRLHSRFSYNPYGEHKEDYWANEFPAALKWLYFGIQQ